METKNIDITQFLFEGTLFEGVRLGSPINSLVDSSTIEKFQDQDGDIPALFQYKNGPLIAEIGVLYGIVISISIKPDDNPNIQFQIFGFGRISRSTKFSNLLVFLNQNNVPWEVDSLDTGGKTIGILFTSMTKIMYSFEPEYFGIFQFVAFDLNLYNRISERNYEKGEP